MLQLHWLRLVNLFQTYILVLIMEACADMFAEVNIDARCQSGHVFLPHPAQEYSFWTGGTSQLMSVPGVFRTRPLAETVFPLKCILMAPKKKKPPKKNSPVTRQLLCVIECFR